MKISAIRPYSYGISVHKTNQKKYATPSSLNTVSNSVNFQGKNAIKGFGLGAIVGIAAVTLLSLGAATPLAIGAYMAIGGSVAGAIGHQIDKTNKEDQ